MRRMVVAFLATVWAGPMAAQISPQPGMGDPRIQMVDFQADQVVRIEAAPGFQVTIELAPDEQIQTVAVGDVAAWAVSANKAGDRLFVKPSQEGAATNMNVVTTARTYNFDLSSGGAGAAYTVRFRYPSPPPQALSSADAAGFYRLSGDQRLWPQAMHDDGAKTFIDWPLDTALPAVYVIDKLGRELLANGQFRDGLYVLDGVERRLIFRIDRNVARASRYRPKKAKS